MRLRLTAEFEHYLALRVAAAGPAHQGIGRPRFGGGEFQQQLFHCDD